MAGEADALPGVQGPLPRRHQGGARPDRQDGPTSQVRQIIVLNSGKL